MSEREDTEQEYWQSVESMAQDALAAEKQGREIGDAVHEACDGSYWVIYTHAARKTLLHSRNEDAVFDLDDTEAFCECGSMSEVYTRAAYYALIADVFEAVDSLREEPADE